MTKQEQLPASEDVTEVAPGILRMQLPIHMPGLGHVNCYALVDDRGATLVDPGLPGPATWKALDRRMTAAGLGLNSVHTVVVTHSHPDHFGTAGRLAAEANADLITHESFDIPWSRGRTKTTPWGGKAFRPPLRRRLFFAMMRRAKGHMWRAPVPSKPAEDGQSFELGGRSWQAVHTPGHTPDHLCLWDPDGKILLSGDHVLPTITPHISGAYGPDDPLADFFSSLEKVADLEVELTLPAHGHPFEDLRGRTKAIHDHHLERLETLVAAAQSHGPSTVEALSHELFRERHWGFMAESETYAHLEHLRLLGKAERHTGDDGLWRYEVS